jgi:secondary thiamine-phosphate synthase enzyme
MAWYQYSVTLPSKPRGFHLITREVMQAVDDLATIRIGMLHVFIQHTSAAVTLNENADPDVRVDLASSLDAIAPENFPYVHTIEGADDMPAHVKSSLMGYTVSVPVRNGQLLLGTWQGIYLCEFRNHGGRRRLVITLEGEQLRG